MMTGMKSKPEAQDRRFPWGTVVAVILVILAGFYAANHNGFLASLLRIFLAP
jgi:hypothetical protein